MDSLPLFHGSLVYVDKIDNYKSPFKTKSWQAIKYKLDNGSPCTAKKPPCR